MVQKIHVLLGERVITQEVEKLIFRNIPPSISTHSLRVERVW